MRKTCLLNNDWYFSPEFSETYLTSDPAMLERDERLTKVRLPHSCKMLPFNYFSESLYQMESVYIRKLWVPEAWRGAELVLTFYGVAHRCDVYWNGRRIAEHSCGYTAFRVRIHEPNGIRYDSDNLLVLRVDSRETLNIPPFGYVIDYLTYGGIYRDVRLDVCPAAYVEDVFVCPELSVADPGEAKLRIQTRLSGVKAGEQIDFVMRKLGRDDIEALIQGQTYMSPDDFEQSMQMDTAKDMQGGADASGQHWITLGHETIGETGDSSHSAEIVFRGDCHSVERWDLDTPRLYELRILVRDDGSITDCRTQRFAFRQAEFRADGFYLNGRKVKIRGLNRHQSYAYAGYAMPPSVQATDARILKHELGCNAVRTSHYPQDQSFIDACDALGLMVFTEFPGWQHIGDERWKEQGLRNIRDMVTQYRNHPSIILWGTRINESQDDDTFYKESNRLARELDPSRPTGGVRNFVKSHFFEDVYTYNDFNHDGRKAGCLPKSKVTSDMSRAYMVTEYNGHMYPTKSFDCEDRRTEHALRHARVLDAVASHEDIAGSFGWCMADYNTHQEFGSGDHICHHGVLDMFRNPKTAAYVYAAQSEQRDVLELSSGMDMGEHDAALMGRVYILSNADYVDFYKNDELICRYKPSDREFKHLKHGPILVSDFVGERIRKDNKLSTGAAKSLKRLLNVCTINGYGRLSLRSLLDVLRLRLHGLSVEDIMNLYTKYIGDWGSKIPVYRFDAVKNGKTVRSCRYQAVQEVKLELSSLQTQLAEGERYDVAAVRIRATDKNGHTLPYFHEVLHFETEGPGECYGPDYVALAGGMGGCYIRTSGETGTLRLRVSCPSRPDIEAQALQWEVVRSETDDNRRPG